LRFDSCARSEPLGRSRTRKIVRALSSTATDEDDLSPSWPGLSWTSPAINAVPLRKRPHLAKCFAERWRRYRRGSSRGPRRGWPGHRASRDAVLPRAMPRHDGIGVGAAPPRLVMKGFWR
jgi:hypothetical protein